MALNASTMPKPDSKFERPDPLDPGTYPARIVQIISLGVQEQDPYKGEPKPPQPMLHITYEILDEFLKDEDGNDIADKPRWISEDFALYNLDSDLAKSTKRYLAIDPTREFGGDWGQLGGAPVMLNIIQKASKKNAEIVYNNVTNASSMRAKEAEKAPELVNPVKIFDVDEPDMEIFGSLPEWLQTKIKENLNYSGSLLERLVEGKEVGSATKAPKTGGKPLSEPENESTTPSGDGDEDW